MKFKIIKAQNAGFCFGVKRAVELTYCLKEKTSKKIFTLGELIHNNIFLERLEMQGITAKNDVNFNTDEFYVIRAHGIQKEQNKILENGFDYIDATCPFVKKIHNIVDQNSSSDVDTVIIGNPEHPEILGIKSYAKGNVYTFSEPEEIITFFDKNVNNITKTAIIVAQTTYNNEKYVNCKNLLKKLYTNPIFFDTICYVTENRQNEIENISKQSDITVVIGSDKSSNTTKLFEISKKHCRYCYITEDAESIDFQKFVKIADEKSRKNEKLIIGITAGASTPDDIIEEVCIRMTTFFENYSEETTNNIKEKNISDDMSFEEMLEASIDTINNGDIVKGIVVSISNTEVRVDLGLKYTGIITLDNYTYDTSAKLEDLVKVGDEVTAVVVRVNDVEGVTMLSKKRLDDKSNWKQMEDAAENGEVVTGKVTEAVKGGLIVTVKGNRIFVPASHTNLPKSENGPDQNALNAFVGTTVKVKVLETNPQRRRILGSIRLAAKDERLANEAKFWETAEVGKTYTGKVKSITAYGAFVDLGGVDGMVHITELSWKHIKHPTDVVSIGDEITVFIKALDTEKKRISLGYKLDADNPWTIFTDKYNTGDVADVKIVSLMPFGAFAEIVPGVDGLIHVSQISDKKIGKPADVLNIGDVVKAKINEIDTENKKVSLSIRALIEPEEEVEEAVEDVAEEVTEEAAE